MNAELANALQKTVVMVGMMGAGKTAVGQSLADMLNVPFRDSDQEIEFAADRTIAEIFERDGEDFFRERETEVLARLLGEEPSILSAGGGAFLQPKNRDLIRQKGVSVWLKADLELLWSRVRHKDTRPLLRTGNPKQSLKDLCAQREPIYAQAEIVVQARPEYAIEDMASEVRNALSARPGVMKELQA